MKILNLQEYKIIGEELVLSYFDGVEVYHHTIKSPFINESLDEHLIANIGLALSLHFFDFDIFDEINVSFSQFHPEQLKFFQDYALHGMAEFNYINNLDIDKRIVFTASNIDSTKRIPLNVSSKGKSLLMIGGGKDSITSKELLSDNEFEYDYLTINANPAAIVMFEEEKGIHEVINISSKKEPKLKINPKYKGHKPASSMWAFTSLILCAQGDYNTIIASNEYSANFPQIKREGGIDVNHQYTKSFQFEKAFHDYVNDYLIAGFSYFSLLRPLYELQIAKIFAYFGTFLSSFVSCNKTSLSNKWCKKCAKCAFVYTILAPFLTEDQIMTVWGEHVLSNELAASHIYDLISDNVSPLECIGTLDETVLALSFLKQKGLHKNIHPAFQSKIMEIVDSADIVMLNRKIMLDVEREENIPQEFKEKIDFKKYLGIN